MKTAQYHHAKQIVFLLCITFMMASCGNPTETMERSEAEPTAAGGTASIETEEELEDILTEEEGAAYTASEGRAGIPTDVDIIDAADESETTEEPEGKTTEAETTETLTSTTVSAASRTETADETTAVAQTTTVKETEATTKVQTDYSFTEENEILIVISGYGADFWNTAAGAASLTASAAVKHIGQYTEVTLTGICREISYIYRVTYDGKTYYTYSGDYENLEEYEASQETGYYSTLCKEMLSLVNELRAENGVAPLVWCEEMEEGTLLRAVELEEVFSHTRPDGTMYSSAYLDITSYGGDTSKMLCSISENICGSSSWGGTAEEAFELWCNSEAHRANMLNEEFTYFCCAQTKRGSFWVQTFGIANENYTG